MIWAIGAVVSASVVTIKVPATPPMVRVAFTSVCNVPDEVTFTRTVSPFLTVPAALVYAPPLTAYWPPSILIGVGALMPLTVKGSDITSAPGTASSTTFKVKALGVVSGGVSGPGVGPPPPPPLPPQAVSAAMIPMKSVCLIHDCGRWSIVMTSSTPVSIAFILATI